MRSNTPQAAALSASSRIRRVPARRCSRSGTPARGFPRRIGIGSSIASIGWTPAAPGKKAASGWVLRSLAGRSRQTAGELSSQATRGVEACSESSCRPQTSLPSLGMADVFLRLPGYGRGIWLFSAGFHAHVVFGLACLCRVVFCAGLLLVATLLAAARLFGLCSGDAAHAEQRDGGSNTSHDVPSGHGDLLPFA